MAVWSFRMNKPKASSQGVARRMSLVRTSRTKPEEQIAKELRRRQLQYTRNSASLPGRPDFVLSELGVVVFVHGCFWHGCKRHRSVPKSNERWWIEKLENTKRRDRRNARKLQRLGWRVFQVWEHEDPRLAIEKRLKRL